MSEMKQEAVQDSAVRSQEKKVLLEPEAIEKGILQLPPYLFESVKKRLDKLPYPVLEALATRRPLSRKAMIDFQIPFNRHQMRLIAVEALYQHLLLDKDIKKVMRDVMRGANEIDGYLYSLTVGAADNEETYRELISSRLRSDWTFDRISLLEQAILLMGCQEILANQTPKAIVINEAVNLAKAYCDETAPKLVNGVLDTL